MRRILVAAVLAFCALSAPCGAEELRFLAPGQPDLADLLPAPPPPGSARERAELAELLALQKSRTPEMAAAAVLDARETPERFLAVLGPMARTERLPLTMALLRAAAEDEYLAIAAVKETWARRRPFLVEPALHPCVPPPQSNSYPSRHNAYGMLMAEILGRMVPERLAALFARARDYGDNRMVAGVHYRSDTEGGRIAGILIAGRLFANPAFLARFQAARAELRAVLGR